MEKFIAVAAALVVFGGAFFMNNLANPGVERSGLSLSLIPFSFQNPSLTLPGLNEESDMGTRAFAAFEEYREYAAAQNIEGVKSLSHQVSPACQAAETDPESKALCLERIANVYRLTESFKREDFKHIFYDSHQVVLLTDYESLIIDGKETPPLRRALFFVLDAEGNPKLLGVKFCPESSDPGECFETNESLRDRDQNGWWDQIEESFAR